MTAKKIIKASETATALKLELTDEIDDIVGIEIADEIDSRLPHPRGIQTSIQFYYLNLFKNPRERI